MPSKRTKTAAVRATILLLLLTLISPVGVTRANDPDPLADDVLALGSWDPPGGISIATRTVEQVNVSSLKPPASAPNILLISSGVDLTAFPPTAQGNFKPPADPNLYVTEPDIVGYGTYAASVILQLVPSASITPMNIYDKWFGQPDDRRFWHALNLAANHSSLQWDAVVVAIPPNHLLDPITAAMAAGEWDRINDLMTDVPLAGKDAPHFGLPLQWSVVTRAMQGRGSTSKPGWWRSSNRRRCSGTPSTG